MQPQRYRLAETTGKMRPKNHHPRMTARYWQHELRIAQGSSRQVAATCLPLIRRRTTNLQQEGSGLLPCDPGAFSLGWGDFAIASAIPSSYTADGFRVKRKIRVQTRMGFENLTLSTV
jgi:hypothetical protein